MRKIRNLQRLGLWAILGLLLSWLISCSSGPNSGQNQELEFWTMQLQPEFTEYFEGLISEFEAENPQVKIKWVDVPWAAMESKILTAVSAKNAPDVVNLNPNFASQLATRDAWLNLNDSLSPEVKQSYLENIWKASTIGDSSFGFPWYLTTRVTIYNQDLLEQADIKKPPNTYQELAEVAQEIKDETGKYAFFVTFVPDDSGEVLESLVQMGVKLVDEEGNAAFDTPEGLAAFQYWVDLYKNELLPKEVLTQGHRYAIELYQAGETALLSSGAEFLKAIANNAPAISAVSASAPQITGETGLKNVAVMNLVVPQDTDKPQEAIDFATFVTNTENQLAFAKAANVLPSTVEGIKEYVSQTEKEANVSSVEYARKVSAKQINDAEVLVPAMKNLNNLQKLIYENLQAAMLEKKTVKDAISNAASEWNKINGKEG